MLVVNRLARLSAVALVTLSFTLLGIAQSDPSYAELPNFHKVDDRLYRGGQPREGGMKRLAALGIKTVINLRGTDDRTRAEGVEAVSEGLQYFNIPFPPLSRPSHEQVARVLDIIKDPANQPVFIHCKRGKDRTGIVVACYRISEENWTGEQALEEAEKQGLHWLQFSMKDYISDFYRDGGIPKGNAAKQESRFCIPCLMNTAARIFDRAF